MDGNAAPAAGWLSRALLRLGAAAPRPAEAPAAPSEAPVAGPVEEGLSAAHEAAGAYWDQRMEAAPITVRVAWWDDPTTLRHLNRIVCGEPIDGLHAGFHRRAAALLRQGATGPVRGISVGCGLAGKELQMLLEGAVESFDCYDVSATVLDMAAGIAAQHGMADRMRFHRADALATELPPGSHGLVYWNNALHHMFDVDRAVAWSRERLCPGGLLAMDDYVGASRFQYADEFLAWTNRALASLPDRLLRRHADPDQLNPRQLWRIRPEDVAAVDPSEAVDSGAILPALDRVFPAAEIIPTGGAIYFAGLTNCFHNFETADDLQHLQALLLLDEAVAQLGHTAYAVAFARKPG